MLLLSWWWCADGGGGGGDDDRGDDGGGDDDDGDSEEEEDGHHHHHPYSGFVAIHGCNLVECDSSWSAFFVLVFPHIGPRPTLHNNPWEYWNKHVYCKLFSGVKMV